MNRLRPEKMARLVGALLAGHTVRSAARLTPCAKLTAMKVKQALAPIRCPCGEDSMHRGWCSWRFSLSEERQRYMGRLHARSRLLGEYGVGVCILASRLMEKGATAATIANVSGLSVVRAERLMGALTPRRRAAYIRAAFGGGSRS